MAHAPLLPATAPPVRRSRQSVFIVSIPSA